MQILKLVSVDKLLVGGSSKPLLITAVDESNQPKQYVMKLFKVNSIEQNFSVAKEIFVNEFAKEFDLPVPDYALIEIDDDDLMSFLSPEEIADLDKGYKFCSVYMYQYAIFNPLVSLPFIKDYDIENLFCFDHLVLNTDRGGFRDKPNLLLNDAEILLIDHELTLPFVNNTSENPNYYNYIRSYQVNMHILTKYLRSLRKKDNLFDEFFENLRYINIDKYNELFDKFDEHNIDYGNRDKIFSYLNWAKSNIKFLLPHFKATIT